MRLIATVVECSVVCVSVLWAHGRAVQQMTEPIEMPFEGEGLTHVVPSTHPNVVYWTQGTHVLNGYSFLPMGKGTFEGVMCQLTVTT